MAHRSSVLDAPSAEVAQIIRDVLRSEMGPYGLKDIDIRVSPDLDGDPSLQIDVGYDGSGAPVDPRKIARLLSKVRDRLWTHGEERFPYLHHHFPDDQRILDDL